MLRAASSWRQVRLKPDPTDEHADRGKGFTVKSHVVVGAAVAAGIGVVLTLPVGAQGARQGRAGAPNTQPAVPNVSQKAGPIKRMPDGTPDIRGIWVRVGGGMNEAGAPDSELKAFGVLS